jgi:dihydrofolate reductase
MKLSLIVAVSENRVIGRRGELPWRLSSDLRRFKRLTMGHHLLMGRKTFESIGRLLPGRTSIVMTRQAGWNVSGALVAHSIDHALRMIGEDDELFVIGGAEVFRLAVPRVDTLYMTFVHAIVEGDVVFPALDLDQWNLVEEKRYWADERNEFDYSFRTYQRGSDHQTPAQPSDAEGERGGPSSTTHDRSGM